MSRLQQEPRFVRLLIAVLVTIKYSHYWVSFCSIAYSGNLISRPHPKAVKHHKTCVTCLKYNKSDLTFQKNGTNSVA